MVYYADDPFNIKIINLILCAYIFFIDVINMKFLHHDNYKMVANASVTFSAKNSG